MVMMSPAHEADTPAGNPLAPDIPSFDIPVAPVVVWVTGVNAKLVHKVGVEDAGLAVFSGITVIVPVA